MGKWNGTEWKNKLCVTLKDHSDFRVALCFHGRGCCSFGVSDMERFRCHLAVSCEGRPPSPLCGLFPSHPPPGLRLWAWGSYSFPPDLHLTMLRIPGCSSPLKVNTQPKAILFPRKPCPVICGENQQFQADMHPLFHSC